MISAAHPVSPEELMTLLDGELAAEEALAVSAHLEHCAECAELAEQFRAVSRSLATWTIPAAPEGLEEAVLNPARNATPSSAAPGGQRRAFWASKSSVVGWGSALAAIIVLSLSFAFFPHRNRPERLTNFIDPKGDPVPATQPAVRQSFESALPPPNSVSSLAEIAPGVVAQKSAQPQTRVAREVAAPSPSSGIADTFTSTNAVAAPVPMIARTVSLSIVVKDIAAARAALDSILVRYQGYSAQLTVSNERDSQRTLQASLRIPAPQLASALADLKALGRVETETQSGEEVTQQHADLVARLQNSRETEQRLRDILSQRTGKIEDVLQVEEEIARVRGEIESMEAEQRALEHRVDFATIDLRLAEDYKEQFSTPSPSAGTQIHNSFVSGMRSALATLLGLMLFLEETGPLLLVWLAILAIPGFFLWRRYRRIHANA